MTAVLEAHRTAPVDVYAVTGEQAWRAPDGTLLLPDHLTVTRYDAAHASADVAGHLVTAIDPTGRVVATGPALAYRLDLVRTPAADREPGWLDALPDWAAELVDAGGC